LLGNAVLGAAVWAVGDVEGDKEGDEVVGDAVGRLLGVAEVGEADGDLEGDKEGVVVGAVVGHAPSSKLRWKQSCVNGEVPSAVNDEWKQKSKLVPPCARNGFHWFKLPSPSQNPWCNNTAPVIRFQTCTVTAGIPFSGLM